MSSILRSATQWMTSRDPINGDLGLAKKADETPGQAEASAEDTAISNTKETFDSLFEIVGRLHGDFLKEAGTKVDYSGVAKSKVLREYVQYTEKLSNIDLSQLNEDEKLAYYINLYNAMVIHGLVALGRRDSSIGRLKFFFGCCYKLGSQSYTLMDVENGLLRGNAKMPFLGFQAFTEKDTRLAHALPKADPRIHFALNCGAISCPHIQLYRPQSINSQLDEITDKYLNSDKGCSIDESRSVIQITQLFKWYKPDFGGTEESILDFLEKYLTNPKKEKLQQVRENKKYKVQYIFYDWGLNKIQERTE